MAVPVSFIDRNHLICLAASQQTALPKHVRFRWRTHVSLPFPFPSRETVKLTAEIAGRSYDVTIRNDVNRVVAWVSAGRGQAPYFRAFLEPKTTPRSMYPGFVKFSRDLLQSVVVFEEITDYASVNEAFHVSGHKITECFDWLGAFISRCQRVTPYMAAWLLYPISHFDAGTVYHEVHAFSEVRKRWDPVGTAFALSTGRHLNRPLFYIDVPPQTEGSGPIDVANELLAEALVSTFRGSTRLAVLNAYAAAEQLANVVFTERRTADLLSHNVPSDYAAKLVDTERKPKRTDAQFLFHQGLKSACGRSLLDERKNLFTEIVRVQDVRHKVAHTGYRPSVDEAKEAHATCCDAVIWLADVGGYPAKPLVPEEGNLATELKATF